MVRERLSALYASHGEKLRYLIVGAYNTLFSVLLFNLLLWLAGPSVRALAPSANVVAAFAGHNYYNVIFWVCWVAAVPHSTITMKYLVFRSPGHLGRQIGRSFLVYLPAQGINSALLWLLVAVVGLHPTLGQLATVVVSTILSYVGHKYFTFRPAKAAASAAGNGPVPDEAALDAGGTDL